MEKDIGRILKGEYQGTKTEIVVGLREYNGKTGVDIREFTKSETYTGPTKKGLRIPAESFEAFKEMINSINPSDLKSAPAQPKAPVVIQKKPTPSKVEEEEDEDSGMNDDGLM